MLGRITKIDTLKSSRNKGQAFTRIYFEMKRGEGDYFWAKTDVVPSFRNYARWKPYLAVGTILDGLVLKGKDTIDADSHPKLFQRPDANFIPKDIPKDMPVEGLQKKLF